MSKTFCVLPWLNLTVDPDGSIKPCCVSQDFIKKNDGTKYNLGYDTIEEIYNSTDFINIRTQMLNGEEVHGCSQCYQHEKIGGASQRIMYNDMWKNRQYTEPVADVKIHYFDLRFGNLCNLNCRSCNPRNSTQLAKEFNELSHTTISKFHDLTEVDINSWYETQTFSDNLEKQLDNIEMLYVTGGEPTINQKNFELLEQLIDLGYSKNIVLMLNTNMTNTNPKFYAMIKQFKFVIFFASIDGYGDMQEYLRYPSKWSQIDSNLQKLLSLGNNISIRLSPVIQITNLNRITELFEYFESINRKLQRGAFELFPIILENPDYLNARNLPLDFKIKSWGLIEQWVSANCKYQKPIFHNKLSALKNKCFEDVDYTEKLTEYFEFNDILDQHRSQSLNDVNPNLYKLK